MIETRSNHGQESTLFDGCQGRRTRITTIPLSSTTRFIVDNRGKTPPVVRSGIKLIATNCVCNDRLYPTDDKLRFVTMETYRTWFRAHPEPGDILLTLKGSQNGAACLVPPEVDFVIAQDMVALRADESVMDAHFLLAALRSTEVQVQIKNLDVSGIIPHLKKSDFDKLLLPYPDRKTQELVGRVYFDFSSKIELNRRMNETLEAMARRLFKSWFVDFDPVHAKAALRLQHSNLSNAVLSRRALPNLDPKIAELFPDSFEDSTLGPIPKGWNTQPLYEIARFVNGAAFKNNDFCEPTVGKPVIKIAELKAGITPQTKYSSKVVGADREIERGNLLYSWSGSPDTSLATFRWTGRHGLLNQHIFKVITASRRDELFAYYQLTELRDTLIEIARNKQTTGLGHVTVEDMKRLRVIKPSEAILTAFAEMAGPHFDLSFNLEVDSLTLGQMRDKLLPRLLSGDLQTSGSTK